MLHRTTGLHLHGHTAGLQQDAGAGRQMHCTSQMARGLLWRLPATPLRPKSQVICALQGMNVPVPACCCFSQVCLTPSCRQAMLAGASIGSSVCEPEGQQEAKWVAGQLSCKGEPERLLGPRECGPTVLDTRAAYLAYSTGCVAGTAAAASCRAQGA